MCICTDKSATRIAAVRPVFETYEKIRGETCARARYVFRKECTTTTTTLRKRIISVLFFRVENTDRIGKKSLLKRSKPRCNTRDILLYELRAAVVRIR